MAALARRGLAWAASDAGRRAAVPSATHVVENQAVSKPGNAFADDRCLGEGLDRYGASWAAPGLIAFGADVGSEEWSAIARAANERVPVLETHDRYGRATNRVVYDGSYHALMRRSLEAGAAGLAWETPGREGGHVARAAAAYLTYQLDPGVACPVTMTFASYPVLAESAVGDVWAPRVAARAYDPSEREVGAKASATVGMSMTEKQGGSDVRSNATTATAVGENEFVLRGHKWFTSAPMSDGFLTLANIDGAPSCFLVPRRLPDGTRNAGFRIQRLKSKLGDRSNASSEIEYDNAWAVPIGAPGRGIRTIVDMVQRTRLDCAIGSAALSREAARAAAAHCATRAAFGSRLIEQPLMARVLADLAVETSVGINHWFRPPGISSNPSSSLKSNSFSMILEPLILASRVLDD